MHSRYLRQLADLPISGRPVLLHLQVRRFRCMNPRCPRRTFVEQVPALAAPYARRTHQLRAALEQVGLMVGARPGQRLGSRLGLLGSRDSLLRLVRALPEPEVPAARVLGVDEFALRRGRVYGTVLVDVESHRPVDLLDDRSAVQFATWLHAHPAPEIICRDRGDTYAEGARAGAPEAIHVADRYHLLANLSDALERFARQHARCWHDDPLAQEVLAAPPPTGGQTRLAHRHHERFVQVHTLVERGLTLTAIASTLHLDRHTVRKFARASGPEAFSTPARSPASPLLAPFLDHLHQRWQEGCQDGKRLLEELRERGYRGSHRTLGRYLTALRRGSPPRPVPLPITARAIAGLLLRRPDTLDPTAATLLERLCGRCPELATTARLAHAFATLVRERPGAVAFQHWLAEATGSGITALVNFAAGLRQDEAAVTAGLTLPWSSGVVEGHNTRIKLIKRMMYGRGRFDLLRRRVLLAS